MTIANWCVLIACLLPIVAAGLAKSASIRVSRRKGGYDNNNPRLWAQNLTGWQQRAHAAQLNSFEALPLFIAAVALAQQAHVAQGRVDTLAGIFIVIRLAYLAAYLMNAGLLRSAIWSAGILVCVAIFPFY
jgi:uncharacterized MAPEG superfamily protein